MERLERVGHLLRNAETEVSLAIRFFKDYHLSRDVEARQYMKKARKTLKQAIEALDGVD
jgi:hypothetical protein